MATTGIQTKILKDGKKSYAVWYKDPATGKQHHYKCYRLKKIAEQEEQKLRILIDTGEFLRGPLKKRQTAVKFEDITFELDEIWARKLNTKELSNSTVSNYRVHRKLLDQEFAGQFVGGITELDIEKYQANIARSISNATSNRRLFILKQVFALAERKGLISRDISRNIRYLSEKEHERTNSLQPHQLSHLLEIAAKARSKHYMPLAILLAAEHGAAKQEILALQWGDIDFEFEKNGWIHFFRTKNGVNRLHPLQMQRTRDALLARRKYLAKCRKIKEENVDGFVIGRPDGRSIADIKSAWETIREVAGLRDFHFHDLRHTFCTNLLRSGASLKMVKEYIGHKTLRMTDRYTHLESYQELTGFDKLVSLYDLYAG